MLYASVSRLGVSGNLLLNCLHILLRNFQHRREQCFANWNLIPLNDQKRIPATSFLVRCISSLRFRISARCNYFQHFVFPSDNTQTTKTFLKCYFLCHLRDIPGAFRLATLRNFGWEWFAWYTRW